jgi:hypothetical protein
VRQLIQEARFIAPFWQHKLSVHPPLCSGTLSDSYFIMTLFCSSKSNDDCTNASQNIITYDSNYTPCFRYYIFCDLIDQDDNGDDQVSIYSNWFDSDYRLTPDQVIDLAYEDGDWRINFAAGDEDSVDTCVIEEWQPQTDQLEVIANKYPLLFSM